MFADLDKLFISTFLLQQFFMCTSLSHSPAINHKDLVGVLYRGQTMGNRNNGLAMCQGRNNILNDMYSRDIPKKVLAGISPRPGGGSSAEGRRPSA